MDEVVHQFGVGRKMFSDIPLCNRNARKRKLRYVGEWAPDNVTCKRCRKIAKGDTVVI